jgi:hypothetical protein
MDVYTDPLPTTYETWTRFYMPTKGGGEIQSIAVSRYSSNLIVAGYSVLLIFLFSAIWKLVLYLVLAFFPSMHNRNQQVLLVGFWNSGDPMTASAFMLSYTWKAFGHMDRHTFGWSCLLLFVAMCASIGGIAVGVLIPAQMAVGTVAPARASEVFFAPLPAEMTRSEGLKIQALRAPAAVRAIGSVEASKVTLRSRASLGREDRANVGDAPTLTYPYGYTVSGWDFGLQRYPEFKQIVTGECVTEYSWLASGTGEVDRYRLWGFQNQTVNVQRFVEENDPPYAEIRMHPNGLYDTAKGGKFHFAIIPHTAGRHSFTTSVDPWYRTVSPMNATSQSRDAALYRVDNRRPALSCWQQTSYTYKKDKVDSVYDLEKLRGFKIPMAWHNHFRAEFGVPKMVDLGISLGRGILLSSATYLDGNFDADSSTARKDLERLVMGTFVASRDIFRDSTMVSRDENAALTPQNRPEPGVGNFVLATGEVMTLRFDILVAVPVTVMGLYLIIVIVFAISTKRATSDEGFGSRYLARSTAFQATQLYRYMDERVPKDTTEGSSSKISEVENDWKGHRAWVPYVEEKPSPMAPSCLEPKLVPATAGHNRLEPALIWVRAETLANQSEELSTNQSEKPPAGPSKQPSVELSENLAVNPSAEVPKTPAAHARSSLANTLVKSHSGHD